MWPNLLLTGPPRVGKTTLVVRVLDVLPPATACGFFTRELRRDGRRVGFSVETLAGQTAVLAHVDLRSPYRLGRYRVDLAAFEAVALPAIDPERVSAPLIVIDEVGKMECFSDRFRELVVAAMGSDRVVLATVPIRSDRFIESLKVSPDVTLLDVTTQNRDQLVDHVVGWVQEVLAGA
jgi:nucleoside-triphosphatase